MSIDEASTATNIDSQYLRALESGNIALLPEPYMRAFLKTYAGFLGLDPIKVLHRFEAFLREESESLDILRDTIREREGRKLPAARESSPAAKPAAEQPRPATFQPRSTRPFAVPAVIILAVVVVIAVAGSILNSSGSLPGRGDEEVPAVVVDDVRRDDAADSLRTAPQTIEPRDPVDPDPQTESTTLEFIAEALEDTWMQAVADGDTVVTRVVTEGREVEITFQDTLAVKIGKNHGMRLWFNGEELTDLGSEGMIISFILTVDGMLQRRLTYPPETIPDFLNIPPGS